MIGSRTQAAHAAIRTWLRDGGRAPGEAIVVKDTALALKLSVTPVREALERLVGERLVWEARDRTGFVMPRLGPREYGELIGLHAILVDGALSRLRLEEVVFPPLKDASDARAAAEAFFDTLYVAAGGRSLSGIGQCVADHLAPFRLVEPEVLHTGTDEIVELAQVVGERHLRSALRSYHKRRANHAVEIVQAREDMVPLPSASVGREK